MNVVHSSKYELYNGIDDPICTQGYYRIIDNNFIDNNVDIINDEIYKGGDAYWNNMLNDDLYTHLREIEFTRNYAVNTIVINEKDHLINEFWVEYMVNGYEIDDREIWDNTSIYIKHTSGSLIFNMTLDNIIIINYLLGKKSIKTDNGYKIYLPIIELFFKEPINFGMIDHHFFIYGYENISYKMHYRYRINKSTIPKKINILLTNDLNISPSYTENNQFKGKFVQCGYHCILIAKFFGKYNRKLDDIDVESIMLQVNNKKYTFQSSMGEIYKYNENNQCAFVLSLINSYKNTDELSIVLIQQRNASFEGIYFGDFAEIIVNSLDSKEIEYANITILSSKIIEIN